MVSWFFVSWFQGLLVSWFLGFRFLGFLLFGLLVSWLLVPWFGCFLVSKCQKAFNCFLKILVPYYQTHISCFWEDIDLISKNFKIVLDGSSGFFGARLFGNCTKSWFSIFKVYKTNMFATIWGFMFFLGVLVFQKINHIGFGAPGARPKIPKS